MATKSQRLYCNQQSICQTITRFDIFNLQYRLPRRLLQIPYDIFNRLNRNMIAEKNTGLNASLAANDFCISQQTDESLDLFFIGTK
ncbi:MAG: hypothetical protein U0T81_13215 [Saprospiraceae bacterium]